MKKIKLLLINGLSASFTSIAAGLCGVLLNMLITKRAGAVILGKYQLILSVCGFALTFALSGVSFAAMRLCAECAARGENPRKIMKKCFLYAAFFGFLSAVILFFASDFISEKFIKYPHSARSLKIFAMSLPVSSCLSAISGYLSALRRAYKESLIKICVQVLKLTLTAVFLTRTSSDPCISIMAASVLAEFVGAAFSFSVYLRDKKHNTFTAKKAEGKLLSLALPIAFSSYLRSGIMTVKNLLVPICLVLSGMTEKSASSAFGIVHGIALPTVLFPSTFLFSFSALTVPEIAAARTNANGQKKSREIRYIADRSVQFTMIFSIFFAVFMFFFSKEIAQLVSGGGGHEYIRLFSMIIPIMYLDNTVDSILKGLDEQVTSMKINILDSLYCLLSVVIVLPKFGIHGYLFTVCSAEILNFALSFSRLVKITCVDINVRKNLAAPLISAAASSAAVHFTFASLNILLKLPLCAALYLAVCSVLGALSRDDKIWLKNIFSKGDKKPSPAKEY